MVPQIKPDLTVKNILRLERHNWVTGTGMARISREGKETTMKVYIGIDWSENKHDVCFLNETGDVLLVKQIPHTPTLHATALAVITGLLHARIAF